MLLQRIHNLDIYVVDFDTMPELPITWSTEEEKPYALALARALSNGTISEPGKYGIHIVEDDGSTITWSVYKLVE
jgi:hypothetical protein